jgi:penicillin-binding protein 1A
LSLVFKNNSRQAFYYERLTFVATLPANRTKNKILIQIPELSCSESSKENTKSKSVAECDHSSGDSAPSSQDVHSAYCLERQLTEEEFHSEVQDTAVEASAKTSQPPILSRCLVRVATFLAIPVLLAFALLFAVLFKYGRDLPDYHFLQYYQPTSVTHIYDRFGTLIQTYAHERREYVHLSDIPPRLIHAFIAAEDKNFYTHCGVDFAGIIRAIITNTCAKRWGKSPVGASTITQQVAKVFFAGKKRSLQTKMKEAILAFRMEHFLNKDRILELYLNQIYLGGGSYGVAMAAKRCFCKALRDLSLSECAALASLPKAPTKHDPFKNPQRLLSRRNWVLARMRQNGFISGEDYERAVSEPIRMYTQTEAAEQEGKNAFFVEEARRELIRMYGEERTYNSGIEATLSLDADLQVLLDNAVRFGLEQYDKRHPRWRGALCNIELGDWKANLRKLSIPREFRAIPAVVLTIVRSVKTAAGHQKNLGQDARRAADIFIGLPNGEITKLLSPALDISKRVRPGDVVLVRREQDVDAYDPDMGGSGFDRTEEEEILTGGYSVHGGAESTNSQTFGDCVLFQIPEVTGGAVLLDAKSGEVLAVTGGYSFELNTFNCATQAMRQPASTFKPFVYLAALRKGFFEHSKLVEKPVTFGKGTNREYSPRNYNKAVYGGLMSLYEGFVRSRNVFTAILASKVGMRNVAKTAVELGVVDSLPKSIVAALGVKETTVVRMAAAFAAFFNGGYRVDPTFFINITSHLDTDKIIFQKRQRKKVIAHEHLMQMKHMLRGVVREGTGKKLVNFADFPVELYGKTGTSGDFKDAWFICGIEAKENLGFCSTEVSGCVEVAENAEITGSGRAAESGGATGFGRAVSRCLLKRGDSLVLAVFIGYPTPRSLGKHEGGARVALPVADCFLRQLYAVTKRTW